MPLVLEPCGPDAFAWLLGEGPPPAAREGDMVAPDLAPPEVMTIVRGFPASWMMIEAGEVVGLLSLLRSPGDGGPVEIGYGVAASREGRGHASRAVGLLLPMLEKRGIAVVLAETSVNNPASQRVLENNRFARVGERIDPEDGAVVQWRRKLLTAQ